MEELEIKKRIIAEATGKKENEIDNEELTRLGQYITKNQAIDGKNYYWYLDCDDIEVIADINGNIIDIEDSTKFFNC